MLNMLIKFALAFALCLPAWGQSVVFVKKDSGVLDAGSYNGTSSKMQASEAVNTDFSFTIFADCETGSAVDANRTFASITQAATAGQRIQLSHTNTGALRINVQTSDASIGTAQHGTTLSTSTKYKLAAISTSTASRHVCHSGTCVENTEVITGNLALIDRIQIGVLTLNSETGFFNGKCKEVGFWVTALTTTDYTNYNSGSATLESLGADKIYRAASGTNLGDVAGTDLTVTAVTPVAYTP